MARDIYEGSDAKLLIDIKATGFVQSGGLYKIDLYNNDNKITFTQDSIVEDSEGNCFLPVTKDKLHAGPLFAVVTAKIPDSHFSSGYREEVARPINLGPVLPVMK